MASKQPEQTQVGAAHKKRKLEDRSSIIEGRQVKIKLAGYPKEYVVNLGLIQKHSPWFAKAFDKEKLGMKESVEGCVELHDAKIATLESFIYWVNEHVIQLADGSEAITKGNLSKFVELYNFADFYDTRELRNDILKEFCCNTPKLELEYEQIGKTLYLLRPNSSLYKALLAVAHCGLDLKKDYVISEICDHFPSDAIKVLIKNFTTKQLKAASLTGYDLFAEKE